MTEVLTTGVDELRAAVRGAVTGRDDSEYDEARTLYNAMIDKHPALIAHCADVADVIAAVNFAPRERPRSSPSAAAATTAPGWAPSTTGWSSISRR